MKNRSIEMDIQIDQEIANSGTKNHDSEEILQFGQLKSPTRKVLSLRKLESDLTPKLLEIDTSPSGRRKSRLQIHKERQEIEEACVDEMPTKPTETEEIVDSPSQTIKTDSADTPNKPPYGLRERHLGACVHVDEKVITIGDSSDGEESDASSRPDDIPLTEFKVIVEKLIVEPKSPIKSPVKSPSVIKEESGTSPRRNYHLNQLETTLSPKLTHIEHNPEKRLSRYGRPQKQKNLDDFVPADVAKFVTKGSPKAKKDAKPSDTSTNNLEIKTEVSIETKQEISAENPPEPISPPIEDLPSKSTETNSMESPVDNDIASPPNIKIENEPVPSIDDRMKNFPSPPEYMITTPEDNSTPTLTDIIVPKFDVDYNENNLQNEPKTITRKLSDADSGKGSSLDIEVTTDYQVGQIVWTFFGKQHWATMIAPDSITGKILDVADTKSGRLVKLHIVYFGCNGQNSWVPEKTVMPYESFEHLYEHVMKGKYPSSYKNFVRNNFTKKRINKIWFNGVQVAEEFQAYPIANRFEILLQKLEYEREQAKIARKRRHSIDIDTNVLKPPLETTIKQERSSSPESPPFEELIPLKKVKKEPVDEGLERFFNSMPTDLSIYSTSADYDDKNTNFDLNDSRRRTSRKRMQRSLDIKQEPVEISPKPVEKKKVQRQTVAEAFQFKLEPNYLFKEATKINPCRICCEVEGKTMKCTGRCYGFYHPGCLGQPEDVKDFKCDECAGIKPVVCFVCKTDNAEKKLLRCTAKNCGYNYHVECLRLFPQHKVVQMKSLCCPIHTCHTCVSEDPRGKAVDQLKNLVKCIKCPSAYHASETCVPAGSLILNARTIICTKHAKHDGLAHINVNWCFICSKGGNLICCETCPTSFHLECLKFTPPPGAYFCEECETGRMPLYNEIVWCKFGSFRWWPALVLPPAVIPKNMYSLPHVEHDFIVKFFGSRDNGWLPRKRVFLYQEGDSASSKGPTKTFEKKFSEALEEAKELFKILKEQPRERNMDYVANLQPPSYIKIPRNKYRAPLKQPSSVEPEYVECGCSESDEDPCGATSSCLSRLTFFECNPKTCRANEKCRNMKFTKREYQDVECVRMKGKGWGLVAKTDIPSGTFIIEYVGEVINQAEMQYRIQQKELIKDEHYYFLTLDRDITIDAGPMGNLARFMNHSCDPNCETQKWNVRGAKSIGLFAIQDIKAGTELTFNYNLEAIGEGMKICHCNSAKCSGYIGSKGKDVTNGKTTKQRKNSTKPKPVAPSMTTTMADTQQG